MYSQDEMFVLMISVGIAVIGWGKFAWLSCLIWSYRYPVVARIPLYMAFVLAVALLYYILAQWSSHDVRDSVPYMVFYLVIGASWLALCRHLLDYLDLRIRDDVLERGNTASAWACGGALLGLMTCFAGGNVGDGPGW